MRFRLLLTSTAMALLATSCQSNRDKMKQSFVRSCEEQAKKGGTTTAMNKLVDEYCECSADRVLDNMSTEELEQVQKAPDDPTMKQRMMTLAQPCLEDMQHKAMAQQPGAVQ